MTRFLLPAVAGLALLAPAAEAQLFDRIFPRGAEALKYGAYQGGHALPYSTAYHYVQPFSAADTWRRDPLAYPAGIYPYRPYGKPIQYRVFPMPETPYISVPGPDGLPILVQQPGAVAAGQPEVITSRQPDPVLKPVPTTPAAPLAVQPLANTTAEATIHIAAPADAEVWVDKTKIDGGTARSAKATDLTPGEVRVYSVRAKWVKDGKTFEQFRVVGVKAGESARLTFAEGM